jgi:signal transduction histidine kinase
MEAPVMSRLASGVARLRWLALARLAALLSAAVLSLFVGRIAPGAATGPLLFTLAIATMLSAIQVVFLRRAPLDRLSDRSWLALVHAPLILDILTLTLIIHLAGGGENPFYPLYAFPIIVAAALIGSRAALAYAGAATLLYTATIVAELRGWLPHHHLLATGVTIYESPAYLVIQCLSVAATCFMAAAGTSMLIGMLQSRTRELAESQHKAEEDAAQARALYEQLRSATDETKHQRTHLDAAYAELKTAHERLQTRSNQLGELNEQLRRANAECKARREELAQVNAKLQEANARLETRSAHMTDLNELLRAANAECRARRDELERLNEELAQANAKLVELEDVRAQFTLLVTHELRAPVAAIQSYLKLILEGYVPENKVRETIEKAERRALEQLALIADLLELGRIGSANARGLVQPVQIDHLLREQIEFLAGSARDRKITIDVDVAAGLPPVLANPDQMKSLWNNLISNAIKYNRDGGRVCVRLVCEGGKLLASVTDTGIGIPAEVMPRLFSEFFRADNAKAASRMGTGLGLSIVKEIVERAGGEITVESELDVGTTFRFWVPAMN